MPVKKYGNRNSASVHAKAEPLEYQRSNLSGELSLPRVGFDVDAVDSPDLVSVRSSPSSVPYEESDTSGYKPRSGVPFIAPVENDWAGPPGDILPVPPSLATVPRGVRTYGDVFPKASALATAPERPYFRKSQPVLPSKPKPQVATAQHEDALEWARKGVAQFNSEENKRRGGMALFNRTFPHRLDDHIEALNGMGVTRGHFIDIGPGVGEITNPEYPAISSLELARALPGMNVIALDLPESLNTLRSARQSQPQIGASLLNQKNVKVIQGDGMASLPSQLAKATDAFGKGPVATIKPGDQVVIRASNSIDIYFPWKQLRPVLERMGVDYRDNPVTLLFADKILYKPAGADTFTARGKVSQRGFNHQQPTTRHVGSNVPKYTLLSDN